ncbi:MAG: hypothetical protein PVG39_14550 [Desulfobacteraceae bacterium]|jgi:hypothetical protein
MNKVPLKVGNQKGERVFIFTENLPEDKVHVTSKKYAFLKAELFCKDNRIDIVVPRKEYAAFKTKITKYFETCFLIELSKETKTGGKNANIDTGNGLPIDRGIEKKNSEGPERGDGAGLYIGAGGGEPPARPKRRKQTDNLDKESPDTAA